MNRFKISELFLLEDGSFLFQLKDYQKMEIKNFTSMSLKEIIAMRQLIKEVKKIEITSS